MEQPGDATRPPSPAHEVGVAARQPRVLLSGMAFGESPRWHGDRLWVSDWGAGEVLALDSTRLGDSPGDAEVVARVDSFPMCIDHLGDGRLLVVDSPRGRLLRQEPGGTLVGHADLGGLGPPPWNEIVVGPGDQAYVNNTGFDFSAATPRAGFVAVVRPDGTVRTVADDVWFPNGMALTPDGSTLLLAESYAHRITAFDVGPDGGLARRRVWADLGDGTPDGICLDAAGAVWFADVPAQRCVRVREGGEVLQTVELDRGCFSCALGGPDGRTLFLVATRWQGPDRLRSPDRTSQVLALRVDVPAP